MLFTWKTQTNVPQRRRRRPRPQGSRSGGKLVAGPSVVTCFRPALPMTAQTRTSPPGETRPERPSLKTSSLLVAAHVSVCAREARLARAALGEHRLHPGSPGEPSTTQFLYLRCCWRRWVMGPPVLPRGDGRASPLFLEQETPSLSGAERLGVHGAPVIWATADRLTFLSISLDGSFPLFLSVDQKFTREPRLNHRAPKGRLP